jgi:hypothetical protein
VGMALAGFALPAGASSPALAATTAGSNVTTMTGPVNVVNMPADISCGTGDNTDQLNNLIDLLPPNTVLNLTKNGCYTVDGTLGIAGKTNLTINGNEAVISQNVPVASGKVQPIVKLTSDTNLDINHLQIDGPYDGTNGGENFEGGYGWVMEADNGVTLNHDSTNKVQGDFLYLSPPYDVSGSQALNTNIDVEHSSFTWAGYHGLTVESANGATFAHNSFLDIGVDAMDFEYDDYSTAFSPTGDPEMAAEDNVRVIHNTWTFFGGDWFASIQGQTPGVQEDNITLGGNTIVDSTSPLIQVVGTNPLLTTAPYDNTDLTVESNHWDPLFPIRGVSGGDSSGSQIQYVNGVDISNDTFPMGGPANAFQLFGINNLFIERNDFTGVPAIIEPDSSGNNTVTSCGNTYGTNGSTVQAACPG